MSGTKNTYEHFNKTKPENPYVLRLLTSAFQTTNITLNLILDFLDLVLYNIQLKNYNPAITHQNRSLNNYPHHVTSYF